MRQPGRDPVRALPDDYQEIHHFSINQRSILLRLNLLSLVPLVLGGLLAFGAWLVYHEELGAPLVLEGLPDRLPSGVGLALVLLVLPLHELVHGLAIQHYGHRPRYGIKLMVLFATSDGAYFRRDEFVWIALAPLVVITAAGLVTLAFLPRDLGYWVALAVTLNAAGAIGDLWMTVIALRFNASVLIRDEEDSMRVFAASSAPA